MWSGPPYCDSANGTSELMERIRKFQQSQEKYQDQND
jgi:hypothetical protein